MGKKKENIAIVQSAYDCFRRGDIPGLLELLAVDVEWELPVIEGVPTSGKRKGRDQVAQFFSQLGANEESQEFEPREFVAQGDTVVALGHYKWLVKATGRTYSSNWVHVFTFGDGKVKQFREAMDTAAVEKAFQQALNA